MNGGGGKRDGRFMLQGWHLAVAILLVLAGLIGLYFAVHRNDTQRRLKALRAAGYPTNFAELAEYTKLPAGAENAAELYMRAFQAFVPPVDEANVPLLGKAAWPKRGTPLPEPIAKATATCLARNQQCLALLHEAAGMEDCQYGWGYWPAIPRTQVQTLRGCARLLSLGAGYHAQKGESDAAAACIRDGLRLSDSLRREPALVHHYIRVILLDVVLDGLERSLNLTAFPDAQLKEIGAALARTNDTLDFTEAMITERCFMIEACRDPSLWWLPGSVPAVQQWPVLRGMSLADVLDSMEDRIEASRLLSAERLERFRKTDDRMRRFSFLPLMSRMMIPGMDNVAVGDLRIRALLSLAGTALAIERYRLATGKVPGQLEELVPQYLERVPTDPFNSQPIRYRCPGPGYLLYSVGTDGHDNGGRERDATRKDEPYDLTFTVAR